MRLHGINFNLTTYYAYGKEEEGLMMTASGTKMLRPG